MRLPPERTGEAFSRAAVGMCITDRRGRVVAVNVEACRMFQMSEDEIIGHSFLIFVPKPERRLAQRSFETVAAGGFLEQPDWQVRLRDGGEMWVRVVPSLFPLGEGASGVLSVLTDVTTSRNAEAARQRAEHRERGFLESNVVGVVEFDDSGRICAANQAFVSLLGTDLPTFQSRRWTWDDLTPSEYLPIDRHNVAALASGGDIRPYAKEFFRCDGSRVAVLVAMARTGGEADRTTAYVLDRTDRQLVEAALREGQETLEKVLDAALSAVVIADTRGTITDWRGSSEKILGWSSEEAVGQNLRDLVIPTRYHEAHQEGLNRYLATGSGRILGQRIEIEARRKDGQEIPVELVVSDITTRGKSRFCAFIRDLTVARQLEEQTKNLHAELERRVEERTAELTAAYAELESFSYSVSHDLRGPLRSIHGFASIVLEESGDALSPDQRASLQRVLAAAHRMGRLIDDLLTFARLARVQLAVERLDISKMAIDITDELNAREPEANVEVVIEEDLCADGDPSTVRFMLMNLIENAWKFSSKGQHGSIHVGRTSEGAFFIRDNGVGFDPVFTSKLFKPFERLHSAEEFPGTGIGLANVQRLVQRHGGTIWAEGEVGRGATFYFTLGPGDC